MGEKNRSGVRTELRDGRKILIVDFRYRDKDGREKRYRRDASVQTRPAALAEAQRLKKQAAERGTMEAEPEPLTFAEFARGDFARLVLPRFKPSTREGYVWLLDKPNHGLIALIGHKRLDAIGAADVRLIEADAFARKARPRYAIVCLHTVLRSAVELGALAHAAKLPKLPPRSQKLPAAPPREIVEQVLGESRGWLRVAIALAALGGLRSGEARALEVGDILLDARRLHVRRAFSAEEIADPKGRDERVVPLAPLLVAILEPALAGRPVKQRVVVGARGATVTENRLGSAWNRLQKRLGLEPRWHYHQLRHFFATALVGGGAHVETVRRLLGHKDLAPTSRYLHATGRDLVDAVAVLPGNRGETPRQPCP
ncbi:MAG TPA: tyrosine-type recombinase/integrase [Polyangiaceae bacterium]